MREHAPRVPRGEGSDEPGRAVELDAAVAGRDLIRACAYTGVDPDNPNQRKFIDFLRANGYKVVSKDIHKYEGGRIKANLDIEIAVDILLLSENLDVVVLVSGDGDFVRLLEAES